MKKLVDHRSLVVFLIVLLAADSARAQVGDTYGFGSRTASLGGAGVAWGFEGFAAYSNPAALSLTGEKRLNLSWGLIHMTPQLTPIKNVVVENTFTSDQLRVADVDTSYHVTFGQEFGFSYVVAPNPYRIAIGVTAFLPVSQLAIIDSGETFVPEYVLYRSQTQRPQVEVGTSIAPNDHLSFGAGLHFGTALSSNATVFLQTDPAKSSSMRLAASVETRASPYLGVLFAPGNNFKSATTQDNETTAPYTLGAVFRFPLENSFTTTVNSGARALGNLAALDFNFGATSVMYYDPMSLELGGTIRYHGANRLYWQLDYQYWSHFKAPSISIATPTTSTCQGDSCGVSFSPSLNPSYQVQNILVPRLGHEINWDHTSLRMGYSYHASIFKNLPTGEGNYLDPPKHMFSVGYGIKYRHFLSFDTPCNVDFNASYDQLVTQLISKSSGDDIGAPGYQAGGKIFGGGVSLTLAF